MWMGKRVIRWVIEQEWSGVLNVGCRVGIEWIEFGLIFCSPNFLGDGR